MSVPFSRVGCEAPIAEQQPRQTEPRGHQFFEPQRGGREAAGKLGHEGDARLAHAVADFVGFVGVEFEWRPSSRSLCRRRRPRRSAARRTSGRRAAARRRCRALEARARKPSQMRRRASVGDLGGPMLRPGRKRRATSKRSDSARRAGQCRVSQPGPIPTTPTRSFIRSEKMRE